MFTQNFFGLLPEDILGEILDHLSPTDAGKAAKLSEALDKANNDNLSWKKKFTWHFPHRLKEFEGLVNVDWKEVYEAIAKDEYSSLSETERLILELIKQSDAPGLIAHFGSADQSKIEFETLWKKDKHDTSIAEWVQKVASRQVEHYFYNVIKKYFIISDHYGQAIDPHKKDFLDRTILYWALYLHEPWEEIEFLISFAGCSLINPCGRTVLPIHLAATVGSFELFKKFIKNYPALLGHKDKFGQTPLLFAAREGNLNHMRYLIKKGVNLDVTTEAFHPNDNGKTALHWAIQDGQTEVALALIEAGADLNLAAGLIQTLPIHAAINKKNMVVLAALLQKKPSLICKRDAYGRTPLMLAADESVNDIDIVKYLLSKGSNPNFTYNRPQQEDNPSHISHDKTALYWAIERDSNEIALALIKAGAIVTTALGNEQSQPIHLAARKGNLQLLKAITKKPYRAGLIHQVDAFGRSPLMLAAEAGKTDVVNYLITKSVDLNLTENEHGIHPGATALYSALLNKQHTETAIALIKAGAEVGTVIGNHRFQPIHLAVMHHENFPVLRALIEQHPALINEVDASGRSPLMLAIEECDAEIVDYLIKEGADLNLIQNGEGLGWRQGMTPLHIAISVHSKIAIALIEAGADSTIAHNGLLPIHTAAVMGKLDVLKALIKKNPDMINQKDEDDRSPLVIALLYNQFDAAMLLLENGAILDQSLYNDYPLPHFLFYIKLHEVTENLISQIPHLRKHYESDETIQTICEVMESAADHFNVDLIIPQNLKELWKKLTGISSLFVPSMDMDKIGQQAATLCAAIIHHEDCFATWPEINTLEELVIAGQKHEFMADIQGKNKICDDLCEQIKNTDTTLTLRTILKEDSLFLKAKVNTEESSVSIQSAIDIDQAELSQLRVQLEDTDPGIILGTGTAVQNARWREKAVSIHTSLIEMHHDYQLLGRKTHQKHIDDLINQVTDLITQHDNHENAFSEIEDLIIAAYKHEKDNFLKKPWNLNFFSRINNNFEKRLDKNDNNYCYPRFLRNIIKKHQLNEFKIISVVERQNILSFKITD